MFIRTTKNYVFIAIKEKNIKNNKKASLIPEIDRLLPVKKRMGNDAGIKKPKINIRTRGHDPVINAMKEVGKRGIKRKLKSFKCTMVVNILWIDLVLSNVVLLFNLLSKCGI